MRWVVGVLVVCAAWALLHWWPYTGAALEEPAIKHLDPCSVEHLQQFHPSQIRTPLRNDEICPELGPIISQISTRRFKAQKRNSHCKQRRLVVVGGGIVGLSHALEAWESGIGHVTLVEKRQNYTRDVWFDLYGPPWFSSLDKLRSWGLRAVDLDLIWHDDRAVSVRAQIMERHLSKIAHLLGVELMYGHSFVGLEEVPSSPTLQHVVLEDPHGQLDRYPFDVLVAAGGSRSPVRTHLGMAYAPPSHVTIGEHTIPVPTGCSQLAIIMRFHPDENGNCPLEAVDQVTGEKILPWDIGLRNPDAGVSQVYKRFFSNYCELQIFFTHQQGQRLTQLHAQGEEDWPLLLEIVNHALLHPFTSVHTLQESLLPAARGNSPWYLHHVNVTIKQAAQPVWRASPSASSVVFIVGDAAVTSHFRLGIGINSMYDQLVIFRRFLERMGTHPFSVLVDEYAEAMKERHNAVAQFEVLSILYEAYCDWLVFIDPTEEQSALQGIVVYGKDHERGDYLFDPYPTSALVSLCPSLQEQIEQQIS